MPTDNMQNSNKKRGYTLLFAVLTATVVLGVAIFITSITRKQFILSSAARDSMFAVYNADSAMECAALSLQNSEIGESFGGIMNCGGATPASFSFASMAIPPTGHSEAKQGAGYFVFPGNNRGCVQVTVTFATTTSGTGTSIIESRGYNLGTEVGGIITCPTIGPRTVERAIRLRYE
jgi:hypothetical protein